MSVKSIWSKVPQSVREPSKESVQLTNVHSANVHSTNVHSINAQSTNVQSTNVQSTNIQQNNEHRAVPAGEKCKHKKWQPEVVETIRAKKWTCYDCVFVCSKCGLNTVGICDSYDCS